MLANLISIVALAVSLMAFFLTAIIEWHKYKIELVRQIGEAFCTAQLLKNDLANKIDEFEKFIKKMPLQVQEELSKDLEKERKDYNSLSELIPVLENIIMRFEKKTFWGIFLIFEASEFAAKVVRFNQRKILIEYDIEFMRKKME